MKTKDEILSIMCDVMPFSLTEDIKLYIKEAMDIYAEQGAQERYNNGLDHCKWYADNKPLIKEAIKIASGL